MTMSENRSKTINNEINKQNSFSQRQQFLVKQMKTCNIFKIAAILIFCHSRSLADAFLTPVSSDYTQSSLQHPSRFIKTNNHYNNNILQSKIIHGYNTELSCQLLGMNCATPTDFTFSFTGFALRGGVTDIHGHGWGIAFYEGRGLRLFHDPQPCSSSPIAKLVSTYPLRTYNMIAHIRYATQGEVCLENVHPFHREMWGIHWSFAHNGDVPMFKQQKGEELPWIGDVPNGERVYQPVGDTDSEKMFCSILNALKAKFDTLPSLPVLYDYLRQLLIDIVSKDEEATILNCLLGCGEHVQFAYSWPGARPGSSVWNGLYYVVREFPFQTTKLSDCDYDLDFSQVCDERDRVAVIATKPLTMNENWIEFNRGELILFDEGLPNKAPEECFKSEISGHGLMSNMIPASATLEEDMRRFCYKQDAFVSYAGVDI